MISIREDDCRFYRHMVELYEAIKKIYPRKRVVNALEQNMCEVEEKLT
jgi:putative lipase involved disintegration of autophagic bodies